MSYRPDKKELLYILTHGDGKSKVKRRLLRESIAEDIILSRDIRAISTNRQLSNYRRQMARDYVSNIRQLAISRKAPFA
jgi:hypothetical protein